MERTAGAALAEWVQAHPDSAELVTLHPAVVTAIGKVRLRGSVLTSEREFLELVTEEANVSFQERLQ